MPTARERLQSDLEMWGMDKRIPVRSDDLREVLAELHEDPNSPPISEIELLGMQELARRTLKRRDAIIKVQQMLLMAPMKSNFTFSRDEMIELFGLPDNLR